VGRTTTIAVILLAACWGACTDSATGVDAGPAVADAQPAAADALVTPPADARVTDAGESESATLTGSITRSAAPAAGGIGHLYIAVFTLDPVSNADTTELVGAARVDDVDMSGDGVSVVYAVTGIPPRAEPYFVTAFLDDNGTVVADDPAAAGPDRGDLIALDGFASPQVTLSSATSVALDLELNFNLPF